MGIRVAKGKTKKPSSSKSRRTPSTRKVDFRVSQFQREMKQRLTGYRTQVEDFLVRLENL